MGASPTAATLTPSTTTARMFSKSRKVWAMRRSSMNSSPSRLPRARTGPKTKSSRNSTTIAWPVRLCGAVGRPGRGLFKGPRHQRRRPDGGPRDAAYLQPAHRQLAAPRGHLEAQVLDCSAGWRPRWTSRTLAIRSTSLCSKIRTAAFSAAKDLIFKGVEQPSGYTEPLLHRGASRRRQDAERAIKHMVNLCG